MIEEQNNFISFTFSIQYLYMLHELIFNVVS